MRAHKLVAIIVNRSATRLIETFAAAPQGLSPGDVEVLDLAAR